MFLANFIRSVLAFALPDAPAWVIEMLATAVPAAVELVQELRNRPDLTGAGKFAEATDEVKDILDESMDGIPEWSDLEEYQRDRIIEGIVELAHFVSKLSAKHGGRGTRRLLRQATRALRQVK